MFILFIIVCFVFLSGGCLLGLVFVGECLFLFGGCVVGNCYELYLESIFSGLCCVRCKYN